MAKLTQMVTCFFVLTISGQFHWSFHRLQEWHSGWIIVHFSWKNSATKCLGCLRESTVGLRNCITVHRNPCVSMDQVHTTSVRHETCPHRHYNNRDISRHIQWKWNVPLRVNERKRKKFSLFLRTESWVHITTRPLQSPRSLNNHKQLHTHFHMHKNITGEHLASEICSSKSTNN